MHSDILDVLGTCEAEWNELYDAIKDDTTLMMRLQDVGPIPPESAKAYAIAGPSVRGSGLPRDARVDQPYSAYDRLPVNVITHDGCDTLGRTIVRIEEVLDSINQIRVALDEMPDGDILIEIDDIPVGREGICTVEAPRGEAVHYVLTGRENRLARWRVRAPTYQNLQAVPVMLKDQDIADVPIAVGSLDPCFSCTERMELVDRESGIVRPYSARELAEWPDEKT
jgi:Ni,Fe-hydrogenase III large subunit